MSGSGAGKTLLMHGIGVVAFGHPPPAKGIGTGEEQEKAIVAAVIRPDPFILLDNLNARTLTSENLCIALSERGGEMRELGFSKMRSANPTAFIGLTGNALIIGLDLVRRIISFEIDAHCEHPERRQFAGDFVADIAAQRSGLLQATLTIFRYGRQHEAALPRGEPLGSYPQWCRWVRDPLLGLGCADPVTRITEAKQADPLRNNTLEIFAIWWECHQDKKITIKELHHKVTSVVFAQVDPKKRNRQALAAQVSKLRNTEVGGFRLTAEGYNPIKYQLLKVGESAPPPPQGDIFNTDNDTPPATSAPLNRTEEGEAADEKEEQTAAAGRVLNEWQAAFGINCIIKIDELVGVAHTGLKAKAALLAVVAMDDGLTISNVLLARWLRHFNGVPVDCARAIQMRRASGVLILDLARM